MFLRSCQLLLAGWSLAIIFSFFAASAKLIALEAESTTRNYPKHWRGHASGSRSIWLHRSEKVVYHLCPIRQTNATLKVHFSNDGGADTCAVRINGNSVGTFQSTAASNFGHLWNSFHSSGIFFVELGAGLNILDLNVDLADDYGIEIDAFEFDVSDDELNIDIFSCKLQCISNTPTVTAPNGLVVGKAVQKSYPSLCTEEDNVNVAIFNSDVEEFEITATLPLYRSFVNLRDEDQTNCQFISPVYWKFEEVTVTPTVQTHGTSTLNIIQQTSSAPYRVFEMVVSFTLKGRNTGHIDAEIGSVLFMTMEPSSDDTKVTVSYIHRNGNTITFPATTFTSADTSHLWNISDFTWVEDEPNQIFITVNTSSTNLEQTDVRIERRYMKPKTATTIFDNQLLFVEVVRVDFWWQPFHAMTVVINSIGSSWDDVVYFRISYKQPSGPGYSQIFVLYQDGNMRLLNPTPSGLDWTPFGTSVIIGQTNADDFRPALNIVKVEIEPEDLVMDLTYDDNSSATLRLVPELHQSTLYVNNLDLKKDKNQHPFATFRSMYVQSGNSDSDHLVSDQSESKRILGGTWSEMNGTTFFLYRRCESKHLTLSPDIKLTITKT